MKVHKTNTKWNYFSVVPVPACIPNRRYMESFPPCSLYWDKVTCAKCLKKRPKKGRKE